MTYRTYKPYKSRAARRELRDTWHATILTAAVAAVIIGGLWVAMAHDARAYAQRHGITTYALTVTARSGDVYVIDHGMSAEDCADAARVNPGTTCEEER